MNERSGREPDGQSPRIAKGESLGGGVPEPGVTVFHKSTASERRDAPTSQTFTISDPWQAHHSSRVTIIEGLHLGSGSEGRVTRVTALFEDTDEPAQLASKRLLEDDELMYGSQEQNFDRQVQGYNLAANAGLPVLDVFLPRSDKKGYLMTDLTDDGKNVVISEHEITIDTIAELYDDYPDLMRRFSEQPSVQSKDTGNILRKASDAQLEIQTDAWFVVVKPDGSSEFVVGDYRRVATVDSIRETKGDWSAERIDYTTERNFKKVKEKAALIQLYRDHPQTVDLMLELDRPSESS